jgi:hypothetical protein
MTNANLDFFDQIRRNAVALISLIIAVSSLSYNTWRNEKTEDNRNQRHAAFEVLLKLNELQQVIFHFTKKIINRRKLWANVITQQ